MQIGHSTKFNLLLPSVVAFLPLAAKLLKRGAAVSSLALLKAKDNSVAEGNR